MSPAVNHRKALLIGSAPVNSVEEAFAAFSELRGYVSRIPDGEPGVRSDFVGWQADVLRKASGLVQVGTREIPGGPAFPIMDVAAGFSADEIKLGPLGYAAAAIASYSAFRRFRDKGTLPREIRFQVSLPSPFTVAALFGAEAAVPRLWSIYERRLLDEVSEICRSIPSSDLAIQWDAVAEMLLIHPNWPAPLAEPLRAAVRLGLARLIDRLPLAIPTGVHFCYGDRAHKHLLEPVDMADMVAAANGIASAAQRSISWVHMPVPRDRDDAGYFTPLRDLRLDPATELYLGLVHLTDGTVGASRRIGAANQVVSHFGIATECGLGRRSPADLPKILALHRAIAELD